MSHADTDSHADEAFFKALSRTPDVQPFDGTDRYRVCRCIGDGGFGVVYEVEDLELGRRLALKTLKPHGKELSANIRRLKSEFRSVADLVHPNLVGLHELSTDGSRWFFTMDMVRGCDFLEYVCGQTALAYERTHHDPDLMTPQRRDTSGILSEPRLRLALRQLVAGVGALHAAGILHRDLKPSNVLVESDGRVVILDFGLAGNAHAHEVDNSLRGAGTPVYMAPEQASGQALTPAADWYAVGVMLYEALTGALPFDAPSYVALAQAKWTREPIPPSEHCRVPPDLERLCLALLARAPGDRPDVAAIVEMLGDASSASEPRAAMGRDLFVGRAAELERLRAAFAAVREGQARVVRLHGQPGMGKSALVAQFLAELHDEGDAVLLAGRCHEREAVPFKALDGVIDELGRSLRRLPRNEASALMPRDIHLVTQLFPALAEVPAVRDVPRRQTLQRDPREMRTRAFTALKELLARLADKQPLVMVIDDLQWSDVDSARLLAQLVSAPEPPNMLLLIAYRADEAEPSEPLREALRMLHTVCGRTDAIDLQPLPLADSEKLAAHLLDQTKAPRDAARTIAQRAEGHPMFMAELARELTLRGRDQTSVPTLVDILWQRILRLPDAARALLETVAIAGQPRSSQLCFAAAGLHGSGVDALRSLRAEQLVRAGDRGMLNVFHDRIRDAVVTRVDAGTRRMRHLALARSLEHEPEGDFEALAQHFDAAEEHQQAARYAERAGDAAVRNMAFDRAAAMYQLAVQRRGDVPVALHRKLADALLNAGYSVAAGEAYLLAASHADGELAVDLMRSAAENMLTVGELDAGHRALTQALDAVGQRLPATLRRARLETMYRLMRIRFSGFRCRERNADSTPSRQLLSLDVLESAARALDYIDMVTAAALSARYCQLALNSGDQRHAALGLIDSVIALIPGNTARPALADELLERAEEMGRKLDDVGVLARAASMRAKTHLAFGDWLKGAEFHERAAAMIAEHTTGMFTEQRRCRGLAGSCRMRIGDLDAARAHGEAVLLDAQERRDPVVAKAVHSTIMAPLALAADDPSEATRLLTSVAMEDRCTIALIRTEAHAAVANYLGEPREAVACWRERWSTLEELGLFVIPVFRVTAAQPLALSLLATADNPRDIRDAMTLIRPIRRLRFPVARACCSAVQGYRAFRDGDPEAAVRLLLEAAEHAEAAGTPLAAAAWRYRSATLSGDTKAQAAADDVLRSYKIVRPERWVATIAPDLS